MGIITYSVSFFIKLLFWLFIPILLVVAIASFLIHKYSKKDKEQVQVKKEAYSALLAILVVGVLLAIVIGFSVTFTSILKSRNLIKGNEIIYYFIFITPLIPFTFLVYYIRKLVQVIVKEKNKLKEEEEIL